MKTCFIAAGPLSWGSSRMRCYWPAKYMQDCAVVQYGQPIPDAHNYIWQKNFDAKTMAEQKARGCKVFWDVCDPAWWWSPNECREILQHLNGVVASSDGLLNDFRDWSGVSAHCIPDRLELSHFTERAVHSDRSPVRLLWYGVAVNRIGLFSCLANLERLVANGHKIELTVMDDRPDVELGMTDDFPVYNVRWSLEGECKVIAAHDVVLTPTYPGPWGKVKSNNKSLTAYACEVPTTNGGIYSNLDWIVSDWEYRNAAGESSRKGVERDYTADKSAAEWEALL